MEAIKNIATVVGCIMSCTALVTAVCKPLRRKLVDIIAHQSGRNEVEQQLSEIKKMIEDRDEKDSQFQRTVLERLNITTEFTIEQCRSIIKDTFYEYRDTKMLPLYERKRLDEIRELYIDKLHQNHWAKALLDVMEKWDVESSSTDIVGIEDD